MSHAACCPGVYYPRPSPDAEALRSDAIIVQISEAAYAMLQAAAEDRAAATAHLGDRAGVGAEHGRVDRALLGALGEYAWARASRQPFDPKPFGLDVGSANVRTRARWDYELVIQPEDARDHPETPYVLVSAAPSRRVFTIRGWLRPSEVRPEWLVSHGGYRAGYYVPTPELHDVRRLIG